MKKLPFCKQCKYYVKKGVCNHPIHGGNYAHINGDFWCIKGEFKEEEKGSGDK